MKSLAIYLKLNCKTYQVVATDAEPTVQSTENIGLRSCQEASGNSGGAPQIWFMWQKVRHTQEMMELIFFQNVTNKTYFPNCLQDIAHT